MLGACAVSVEPDAPGLTAAWLPEPGGCCQCWLLPPLLFPRSSPSPPPTPGGFQCSPLSTPVMLPFLVLAAFSSAPLLCFHLFPCFSITLPAPAAFPSPCCFPLQASALIGWLFLRANPTQACTTAVMPELSLTRCGLGCSSAPPTSLVISTFDRLGLLAACCCGLQEHQPFSTKCQRNRDIHKKHW